MFVPLLRHHSIESEKKKIHVITVEDEQYALAMIVDHPLQMEIDNKASLVNVNNQDVTYDSKYWKASMGDAILRALYSNICLLHGGLFKSMEQHTPLQSILTSYFSRQFKHDGRDLLSKYIPFFQLEEGTPLTMTLPPLLALDICTFFSQLTLPSATYLLIYYASYYLIGNMSNKLDVANIREHFYYFSSLIEPSGDILLYLSSGMSMHCVYFHLNDFLFVYLFPHEAQGSISFVATEIEKMLVAAFKSSALSAQLSLLFSSTMKPPQ